LGSKEALGQDKEEGEEFKSGEGSRLEGEDGLREGSAGREPGESRRGRERRRERGCE
jgi:hypothetical protein